MELQDIKKMYFLGIGGIGMSALARYFNSIGVEIHGYDRTETPLTKRLVDEGMKIHYQENLEKIPAGLDLVVFTPAIPSENKELQFLQQSKLPLKKRAEVLGIISRSRRTIAVAGTHGKTTTTSILTHLLKVGGVDCTAFLGGIATNYNSNYVEGKSDWVVVEADEYDRSFLHLSPEIAGVLSMDPDHLDIYGDLETMHESGFKAFLRNVNSNGKVIVNEGVINHVSDLKSELFDKGITLETYGRENGDYLVHNIKVKEGWMTFDFFNKTINNSISGFRFPLPGKHNVENAGLAISIAMNLGVSKERIAEGLASFKGIKRRFEFIIRNEERVFVNDYAHHPTELKAAIGAAKELYPDEKITGIFQPHLFSRTQDFQDGFAEALDMLDECLLMEIYPAREKPIPGVSSRLIFEKMKLKNKSLVSKENLLDKIKELNPKVVLTLGAGDINALVPSIEEVLGFGF